GHIGRPVQRSQERPPAGVIHAQDVAAILVVPEAKRVPVGWRTVVHVAEVCDLLTGTHHDIERYTGRSRGEPVGPRLLRDNVRTTEDVEEAVVAVLIRLRGLRWIAVGIGERNRPPRHARLTRILDAVSVHVEEFLAADFSGAGVDVLNARCAVSA